MLAQGQPTGTVIASNMGDNTASVIDAASGRTIATLPTGDGPHEVAVSHDGRWATVSNYGTRGKNGSTITVIDVAAHLVSRTIDLQQYQRPHGMAFLPGDTLLVVTSETSRLLLIVDFRSGAVLRTIPTNGRTTHMLGVSADGKTIVASNVSDGTIGVMHSASPDSAKIIRVARQPEGIAISPDGATAWVGSNRDSVVLVVDLARATPIDTLRGFGFPYRMAITPDGRRAVISDPPNGQVRIYNAATRQQESIVNVPRDSILGTTEFPSSPSPEGITITRDSRFAFVTLQGRSRLITIDLSRGTIVGWAVTGTSSDGVGFSQLTTKP